MNRISALLILSGLLALPASGATDSLCWNRDTERMDFYTNPPTRGDNDNFEASSYTCSSSSCPTDSTGGKAWRYVLWPANDNGTQDGSNGSIDDACTAATTGGGYLPTDTQDCQLCLKTKGYWINYKLAQTNTSSSAMVAKGNWLNFFPPKWATLRLAYKRLVNGPLLNSLREGIGTQNGAQGWYRLQKMLPQSCTGQGRPNQRIASVDSVTYTNTANPIAEMLFNVAWTVSSIDATPPNTWSFFANQSTHPASENGISSETNKKAGFCPGCNSGFSVLISDGRGIDGRPGCDGAANIALHPWCNGYDSHDACSGPTPTGSPGLGLGAEKDGDDYLSPNMGNGAGPVLTQPGAPYYPPAGGVCPNDFLPSVAAWMFATNLGGQPGTNLRLYTLGVGDNYFGELEPLRAAASAGHGLYLDGSNFAALERNLTRVFLDIISNATSFSVAAITTVQTRGTTFAFIPRFRPLGGSQWEGRLYRFRLFNEFAAGCSSADYSAGNVATMTDYMKLSGVNSDFCVGMGSTSRHAYATEQDCGTDLMKFVEGRDVLRQNTDGGLARPNILGDIFHSSPILVTPPAPTFLCETGIVTQCVRTLYAEDVAGQSTPGSKAAYTSYYNSK